ncbi:unannotated protein [freshwater metagenome]|uniref:Unannotated protein n=1 Tax=freshwater metagenome TaxID=449393 RepID=A0A6J5ZST8_9ZZZZ
MRGLFRNRRAQSQDAGAAAVEFALISPLLLLLIFMLIDFGRLFYCQISLNSASHEAARASALRLTTAQISTAANNAAPSLKNMAMSATGMTVTVNTACAAATATLDAATTVTLTQTFHWTLPVGILNRASGTTNSTVPNSTTMTAKGVMLCT